MIKIILIIVVVVAVVVVVVVVVIIIIIIIIIINCQFQPGDFPTGSTTVEDYLGPCQTSVMEFFCKNS